MSKGKGESNSPKKPKYRNLPKKAESLREQDRQALLSTFLDVLSPSPLLTISDYAHGHLYIPPPAQFTGFYDLDLTPYAREIMNEISPMSPAREIIIVTGTQMSKTQIALNSIAYYIENDPTSILIAFPNEGEGKHYVRTRIDPMIDYNPRLRELVGKSTDTLAFKEFPGGFLKLASGEAANSLKSTPCRIVFLDEYDGFPANIQGQGSGIDLAGQRTTTFRGREKIVVTSTPVNENSQIMALYANTDMRRYFLTSPNGTLFELNIKGFRWKATGSRVREVWYEIEETGERIEEYMIKSIIQDGQWISTATELTDPTSVGFWINGLYSPFRSWRDIATTYIRSLNASDRGDSAGLTSFHNNILALPYEENTARPDCDKMMLWAKHKDYGYKRYTNAGVFHKDILFLTSGTDVQENRLETEIKGWCRNGKSISVEHFIFPCEAGKTTKNLDANCWREYKEKVLFSRYLRSDGIELGIAFNAIDRSFIPEIVQEFASSVDPRCERVIPIIGRDSQKTPISDLRTSKMTYGTSKTPQTVMFRTVGVSRLKGDSYHNFRLPYDQTTMPVCMFCEDYEREYFEQLTAEEYIIPKSGKKGSWRTIRNRNEGLDLHVYNLAMWYYSGAHAWQEEDYIEHEKKLAEMAKGQTKEVIARKRYLGRQTFRSDLGI